ncbi:MAG: carboxypeptidase-like regulatory domain-containing protein [Rhodothermales bacterium]|nr:carboxypeptidase-like regulatory domain-containing protein [Rhodothermales bacterium]
MVNTIRLALVSLAVIGLSGIAVQRPLAAQEAAPVRYTLVLQGVALDQALEDVAARTGIDLVYSESLVGGQTAYCAARALELEALLRCVLNATGVDFVRSSSGTYVLIEALRQPAARGNLAGSIVDEVSGRPLPFANVLLADAAAGTTTNEDGLFGFSQLVSGKHRVIVTYMGYETRVDSIWVRPGLSSRMQIRLRPREIAMDPIVVTGIEQRLPSERLGRGERGAADLEAIGSLGTPDVARGAGFVTGVTVQQPLADIHIQGGASGEHLTLLDGVPVRDPVSLGRHLSAFSPLSIERLRVQKAGFGAEYGSHLSGLVLVEHDVDVAGAHSGTITADPLSANAKVKGRIRFTGDRSGSYMATVRTSAWEVYQDPSLRSLLSNWHSPDPLLSSRWTGQTVNTTSLRWYRNDPVVNFSDAHAALRFHFGPFRVLNASVYRATNGIRSVMQGINANGQDQQELMYTRDDYDWTNWAAQVRHSWILGARSVASVQARGSWHDSRYGYQALHTAVVADQDLTRQFAGLDSLSARIADAPGSSEGNQVNEYALVGQVSHSFSPSRQLDLGIEGSRTESWFLLRNAFLRPFQYERNAWLLAGFIKSTTSLGLGLVLEAGLRTTYLPARQTLYGEPRLALRYDRQGGVLGDYALRFSGGLYRQFTNQFELTSTGATAVVPSIRFWLPVDASMAPPRVAHLVGDLLLMPATGWSVRLESYLKLQPRLVDIDYVRILQELRRNGTTEIVGLTDQSAFISPMAGRSAGGSLSVQRDADWGDFSVGYSYSHAVRRYPGRFGEAFVPVPWNEPHRVVAEARLPLLSYLSATVAGQGSWGRRWALRRTYYDFLAAGSAPPVTGAIDLNAPGDEGVPAYLTFDIGLTYEQRVGPTWVRFRATVLNLYDRQNVYDYSIEQNGDVFDRVPRVLPGRQVVLSLRLDM